MTNWVAVAYDSNGNVRSGVNSPDLEYVKKKIAEFWPDVPIEEAGQPEAPHRPKSRTVSAAPSLTGKTKLDQILDRVEYAKHEVTIDVEGYTPEQRDKVIAAAKARGFNVSGTHRWLLIRKLTPEASRRPKAARSAPRRGR